MTTPASGHEDPATELLMRTANDSPAAAAHSTGTHLGPPGATPSGAASSPVRAGSGRKPSPVWYGGLTIGLLFVMAAILLSYTLLDWGWQQDLGWWNYVAVIALIPIISVMMRMWQPDRTV